ncbi:MAG: FtsX-like permease family protein [Candidatus Cloacimonetes bacterium]|jgi:ABC-type antimicrobial peptide transport system permease subunit|nr:FtsX-like permease family protein [Candidatus Cloacimonadota bacterium]
MLKNYFKIALRNIIRHKGFSFINIFGLAIGIAACLLISLWVQDELNYDKFHQNSENIFQMIQTQYYDSGPFSVGSMPGPLAGKLLEHFPEVKAATRYGYTPAVVANGDKSHNEYLDVTDNSVFSMFTFPFAFGDKEQALSEPYSIVLSPKMAKKYFNEENPLGKTLTINNKFNFTVTGVMEKIPSNSSFELDLVVPFEFLRELGENIDGWTNNHATYIQLHSNVDYLVFNDKVKHFFQVLHGEESTTILYTFPFTKKHLYSATGRQDNITGIYLISIIAFLILVIACINYMNLSTARSARRAREVGLRKVVGANRIQLSRQFLFESLLLALLSMAFALVIVELVLPYYNSFVGKDLSLGLNSFTILLIAGIVIGTGIVAGSYPAFLLSSFKPVKVLKGSITSGKGGMLFRKILVIIQFTLSIILIISTITIFNQLRFMQNKKLGLDKEDVMYIRSNDVLKEKYESFRSELTNHPDILSLCGSSFLPTGIWSNGSGWDWNGREDGFEPLIGNCGITRDFAQTLGINMLTGREFNSRSDSSERSFQEIIINKTLADMTKLDNPIGEHMQYFDYDLEIVGVMDDFNFKPLAHDIEPLIFYNTTDESTYYLIKYNGLNQKKVMDHVKAVCKELSPGYPVSISFLDESYDRIYRDEKKLATLFNLFASLAVIISCLGLFGLASYLAERRTKEIGIRKVLGSSVTNLVYLLTVDFIKWVLVANIIACPIAWYVMHKWLQNYAYHTPLSVELFILTGLITFLIAFITVGYQTIKAANSDPVKALKYE